MSYYELREKGEKFKVSPQMMNIAHRFDQYDDTCIFLCEPTKNNVMNEGNFIRILYSTHNVVLNGVYLSLTLTELTCDRYYSKYKCTFNVGAHRDVIDTLRIIEEDILKKYEMPDRIPQFKIFEQMRNGCIKTYTDIGTRSSCTFLLKISGIWETQHHYGLTFKFISTTGCP